MTLPAKAPRRFARFYWDDPDAYFVGEIVEAETKGLFGTGIVVNALGRTVVLRGVNMDIPTADDIRKFLEAEGEK